MDQARLLRGTDHKTSMVLPMQGFTSSNGVVAGISRFVDFTGIPVTLYLKSESNLELEALGRLVDVGRVIAVKYSVVRPDSVEDPYLQALVERITSARAVSGMGERPALVHLSRFGLASFTTGSGCIAPRASMRLLHALKHREVSEAEALHARFMPLEDLRESISLVRVLHDAVTLSGIADMGAHFPLLSACPPQSLPRIQAEVDALMAFDQGL